MKKINIAIDGYSSCGKSTLAKQLAKELKYKFIDTGAMYRAITLFAIRNSFVSNSKELDQAALIENLGKADVKFMHVTNSESAHVFLNGEDVEQEIRQMHVAEHVSGVASIPEVRKKLVSLQQEMGKEKGVVMDGRDIGTVVFPDAELKLFMTASPEIRVERRLNELIRKGDKISKDEVRKNLEERDYKDTHRAVDPLKQAEDAIVLDNSYLTPVEQFQKALALVNERLK